MSHVTAVKPMLLKERLKKLTVLTMATTMMINGIILVQESNQTFLLEFHITGQTLRMVLSEKTQYKRLYQQLCFFTSGIFATISYAVTMFNVLSELFYVNFKY